MWSRGKMSGITAQPQKIKCFDCVIYWRKQCPDCKSLIENRGSEQSMIEEKNE